MQLVEKVLHVLAVFSVFVSFFVTGSLVTRQTAMQLIGCLKNKNMKPENVFYIRVTVHQNRFLFK